MTDDEKLRLIAEVHEVRLPPPKMDLSNVPTRQLLHMLKQVRGWGPQPTPNHGEYYDYRTRGTASHQDIKAELAEREHVPNKAEAKELRRKRHKGLGKRDRPTRGSR